MRAATHDVDLLVIGGGPTGLGAAWRLHDHYGSSPTWMLVDGAASLGGLAGSVADEHGFTWDLGGHVLYSHYAQFDALLTDLLGPAWEEHERAGWIRTHGRFLPYPIQRNVRHLPTTPLLECLDGLVAIQGASPVSANDFESWLLGNFGQGLVDVFFRPFNRKMWAHEPRELASGWTRSRSGSRNPNVPLVDLSAILRTIVLGVDDRGWDTASRFRYPAHGGTGAIWQALADRLPPDRLHPGRRVVDIDSRARQATLSDGSKVHYGAVVSSMPLDTLLETVSDQPELSRRAGELDYASTHLVGIGFAGPLPAQLHEKFWLYFPEPQVPFHRATVLSNYSAGNVPDPAHNWSLLCEVNHHPSSQRSGTDVLAACVDAVLRTFDLQAESIVSRWYHGLERGYPVPTLRRDSVLAAVQPRLQDLGVYSRGRFGGWRYEVSNQDHAFMQGGEAVDAILTGAAEMTYERADAVNDGLQLRPVQ